MSELNKACCGLCLEGLVEREGDICESCRETIRQQDSNTRFVVRHISDGLRPPVWIVVDRMRNKVYPFSLESTARCAARDFEVGRDNPDHYEVWSSQFARDIATLLLRGKDESYPNR